MGAMSKQAAYLAQAYLIATLIMIPALLVIAVTGTVTLLLTSPAIASGTLPITPDQQKTGSSGGSNYDNNGRDAQQLFDGDYGRHPAWTKSHRVGSDQTIAITFTNNGLPS